MNVPADMHPVDWEAALDAALDCLLRLHEGCPDPMLRDEISRVRCYVQQVLDGEDE